MRAPGQDTGRLDFAPPQEETVVEVSVNAAMIADGSLLAVDLGAERVTIASIDGAYYAFSDTCTHRGCSLAEGSLSGNELVCECHGARFDVTNGEVLGGPAREALQTFRVSVSGDNLTISA